MNRRIIGLAVAVLALAVAGLAVVPEDSEADVGSYSGGSNSSSSTDPYYGVSFTWSSSTTVNDIYAAVGSWVSITSSGLTSITATDGYGISVTNSLTKYTVSGVITSAGDITLTRGSSSSFTIHAVNDSTTLGLYTGGTDESSETSPYSGIYISTTSASKFSAMNGIYIKAGGGVYIYYSFTSNYNTGFDADSSTVSNIGLTISSDEHTLSGATTAGNGKVQYYFGDGLQNTYITIHAIDYSVTLVQKITVSASTTNISVGGGVQCTATVTPSDATDTSVTWSIYGGSANASISSTGYVTGIQEGSAVVRAMANDGSGVYGLLQIQIDPTLITSIQLDYSDKYLEIGDTATVTITINPTDATNQSIKWQYTSGISWNESTMTVTAKAEGTQYLYAYAQDGSGVSDYLAFIVSKKAVSLTSVSVSLSSSTIEVDGTTTATATYSPSDAYPIYSYIWSSLNTSIATVSGSGSTATVTGVGTGTTYISCAIKQYSSDVTSAVKFGQAQITVEGKKITSITISGPSSVYVGESITWTAAISPSDAEQTISWQVQSVTNASHSDSDLTTTITGKAVGTVTVKAYATDGTTTIWSNTGTVQVLEYVTSLEIVQTGGDACSLGWGRTTQFKVTALPTTASDRTVSWSVANQGTATVSVDDSTTGTLIVTVTAPDDQTSPSMTFTFKATGQYGTKYAYQKVEVLPQWNTGSASEPISGGFGSPLLDELYTSDVSSYYTVTDSGASTISGARWGAYTVTALTVTSGYGLAVDGTSITGTINKAGEILITATYSDLNGTSHTVEFSIIAVDQTVALTGAGVTPQSTSIELGKSITATGWCIPTGATGVTYSWSIRSGGNNIDLTADGKTASITGKSTGGAVAVFTCYQESTDTTMTATVQITVTAGAVAITEIRIGGPDSLVRGESYTYMVSALPTTAEDRSVTVTVTGGTYETTATDYGAAVTVTASAGTSITISATSGSVSASKTVTVVGTGEAVTENVGIVGIADVMDDSMGTTGKNIAGILIYIAIMLLAMHILGAREGGKLMAVIIMIPVTLIFGVLGLVTTDVMLLMIVITVAALAIIRKEGSRCR